MTDYITLGAELAAKLSNAEGDCDKEFWLADHFTGAAKTDRAAFGKFCAQVLEERAAPPGVRTPASDRAAVDIVNSYDGRGTAWSLSDLGDPLFYMINSISEQIAANHALRREIAGLLECEAVVLAVTKELDEAGTALIAARDERIAELEAGWQSWAQFRAWRFVTNA